MDATSTAPQIIEKEVSREEIQDAIAKTVELRAIHAALMMQTNTNTNSPSNLRLSSASPPLSRPVSHFSAHDYPIFTPSYEDEPILPGYQQLRLESGTLSECWDEYGGLGGEILDETILSYYKKPNGSSSTSIKGLEYSHICPTEDQKSVSGSITVLRTSPQTHHYRSSGRRNSLGDFKSISSCNKCKPAIISTETEKNAANNSNVVVPLTDLHAHVQSSQPKNRGGLGLSWLFPLLKKKKKKNGNYSPPNRTESEEASQIFFKDLGIMSVERLKKELMEANESRDAALMEVGEMKSSLGELKQKLEYLETYCEELKKALRQAKEAQVPEKLGNPPTKRGEESIDGNGENLMPVSKEVMVEGFLQIVSEARLSVKQFCKTLVGQIEETDTTLMESLNLLLQHHKLPLNSKYSKVVLYHLEAIMNQSLYQDFENCVFQKNGSPKLLDPRQDRQAKFTSFVGLRNLSWNEVLRKGTKYYSEEFSKFCDQKMSCIISSLNWTTPWPEPLLQSFFVAAKCIWLLHLLAFSFNPPIGILRVEENTSFDSQFMEDIFMDRQRSLAGPSRVKIVVMPGFYVLDRVLKCKVLCRIWSFNLKMHKNPMISGFGSHSGLRR